MGRKKQVLKGRLAAFFRIGDHVSGTQNQFLGTDAQELEGVISYIHPEGLFINITGPFYTESFYLEDVTKRGETDAKLPEKAQ